MTARRLREKELNMSNQNYLAHHGILGMKWGVRRYQNPDGSLTAAGMKRYYKDGQLSKKGLQYNGDERRKYNKYSNAVEAAGRNGERSKLLANYVSKMSEGLAAFDVEEKKYREGKAYKGLSEKEAAAKVKEKIMKKYDKDVRAARDALAAHLEQVARNVPNAEKKIYMLPAANTNMSEIKPAQVTYGQLYVAEYVRSAATIAAIHAARKRQGSADT